MILPLENAAIPESKVATTRIVPASPIGRFSSVCSGGQATPRVPSGKPETDESEIDDRQKK